MRLSDVINDMPIRNEDIKRAIVICIEEPGAEADVEITLFSEVCLINHIGEGAVAVVAVERVRLVREISDEDIERAIAVVIACGNAHAGLRDTVETIGAPGEERHLGEGAIAVVIEKVVPRVVVSNVEFWRAIVIEVCRDYT